MRSLILALLALLGLPQAAEAGRLSSSYRYSTDLAMRLDYAAEPGETARLRVTTGATSVTFRDEAGTIDATEVDFCAQQPDRSVRCDLGAAPFVSTGAPLRLSLAVQLGPGDDAIAFDGEGVRAQSVRWGVSAGEGDDVVGGVVAGRLDAGGGAGADRLTGGGDADALDGGTGSDDLRGGDGDDVLVGGVGDDRLDGAAGRDEVSYAAVTEPVAVDLADPGPDGPVSEADVLTGIEDVAGGAAPDRIAGDAGANRLRACGQEAGFCGIGADRLDGREGADVLEGIPPEQEGLGEPIVPYPGLGVVLDGGPGDDLLAGRAGPDRLTGGPGADLVSCGGELDRVLVPDAGDALALDCERIEAQGLTIALRRPDAARVELTLPRRCGGAVRLVRAGRTASRRFGRAGGRRVRRALPAPAGTRRGEIRLVYSRCGRAARLAPIRFGALL